jgi:hypothetical protein
MPFSTSFSLPSSSCPSGDVDVAVVVAARTSGLTSGSATADETLVLFWKKRLGNMVTPLLRASLLAHKMRIVKSSDGKAETNDTGENGVQAEAQGTGNQKKKTTT